MTAKNAESRLHANATSSATGPLWVFEVEYRAIAPRCEPGHRWRPAMLAYRILSCRLMKAITALVVVAWLASVAGAQPRQPRPWFNMTACELYAELDLFPAENKYPALISGYIRSAIDQIRERGKVDRDSKIQEASYMLVRASVLTKDHGEKYFSSPERALAQLRRDIQDGMTAMGQACDTRGPG